MHRIVGGSLVGHQIGKHSASEEFLIDVDGVAKECDRDRGTAAPSFVDPKERFIEALRRAIDVPGRLPPGDAIGPAFHHQHGGPGHDRRKRLRAPIPPSPALRNPAPRKIAAIVLPAGLDERLEGAADDPLRADIDPRPRGHLTVHHETLALELVEVLARRPFADEVRVGDQHARGVFVGQDDADRLAGLDQEGLVVRERLQFGYDAIERRPVTRRLSTPAVDDEFLRAFRHLGIEVIHQHPQRTFRLPAARIEAAASGRANHGMIGQFVGHGPAFCGLGEPQATRMPHSAPRPTSCAGACLLFRVNGRLV